MLKIHVGMQVDLHLKCTLLYSDFDYNWNVWTNFSKTPYQISGKSIELFSYYFMCMDRVILMGASQGSKLMKKSDLILIVFARLILQTLFCIL